MKQNIFILFLSLAAAGLASCTSARWTVKNQAATDKSDYEILQQDYFLQPAAKISPDNPVLTLDLLSKVRYQYNQRVLIQRNIQEYRLRPGFLALGLGSAAMAFYVANADVFKENITSTKSITLNAAGALLAVTSFLNMKAVGQPRPTGEERMLRSIGDTVKVDTVQVQTLPKAEASVEVRYEDRTILNERNRLSGGRLEVALGSALNDLNLTGRDLGKVSVTVEFEDSTYFYEYPAEDILHPFAKITAPLTELRSSPDETADNILADLLRGSQVQVKRSEDDEWYRVLYGISESFIQKEGTRLIWRSADFAEKSTLLTLPNIPFGEVDVENNIPILRGPTPNAVGIILTNQNYTTLPQRVHAHRDGRLMETYLTTALGYPKEQVYLLQDVDKAETMYNRLAEIYSAVNDSTQLFVYLSGYGAIDTTAKRADLALLGVTEEGSSPRKINLRKVFESLAAATDSKTVIVGDLDFSRMGYELTANEGQYIIDSTTESISQDKEAALLVGSQMNYPSSLYMISGGEDKKHHIFPYYFAQALQKRRTSLSAVYEYLERNVTYTARKLHDRPQDPYFIGDITLDLAGSK